MAKIQQKSEKITAFGGIFFVLDADYRALLRIQAVTVCPIRCLKAKLKVL